MDIFKFHCLENSTCSYVILLASFKLYLYPNGYGIVVIVGLVFAIIIYVNGFLCPITNKLFAITRAFLVHLIHSYTLSLPSTALMYISGKPLLPVL